MGSRNGQARLRLWQRGFRHCFYCLVPLVMTRGAQCANTATVDHILPRSEGGTTHPGNTVMACYICNGMRGIMTVDEFRAYLQTDHGKERRARLALALRSSR